jgi:hypothetical protein
MLQEIGIRMAAEATTRESLIRELRTASDTTINTETGQMILHSSLTIYAQELTVFLGYNNLQLLSDLTDWYDCRTRWIYRTKNMGTDDITGVWVNLFGATTPSLLQTTLPADAIGGGLTSRMIFVFEAKKGKTVPIPFLSEHQESLRPQLVHDLESMNLLTGQFKHSTEFVNSYMHWYIHQEENPPFQDDRLAGYVERRANHILKLSMIMSASRTSEMYISGSDFERARVLLEETERNMPRAFSGVGRSALASVTARINAVIHEHGTMDSQEITRRFSHDADSFGLNKAMETLIASGAVVCSRVGTRTMYSAVREPENHGS